MPRSITRLNRSVLNKGMVRLTGHGPLVEIQHVGRRSGRVYRTPLMAFRRGDVVTIALTYGRHVDWLANVRAAKGCRMRMGHRQLTLGAPSSLTREVGLSRMPLLPRMLLPILRCEDYVELPLIADVPFTGWS
ncbi:nitroreductase family deazaflavin-dependent oxidoreductase [Intrasporangium oryzae]|nr:nitroreductase family deazaflavin-dependent oxidoreductase [Intrasporangium oryzae]